MTPAHNARFAASHSQSLERIESADFLARRRVIQLMLFRLILITLVLGATILLSWLSKAGWWSMNSVMLFAIIGTTYLLSLVYAMMLRRASVPPYMAEAQIAADLLMTTLLVHVTGGAQSTYSFLFPLSVISAATFRYGSGVVVVAVMSGVLYFLVSLLGWMQYLPIPDGQPILPHDLTSLQFSRYVALNAVALLGVGVLAYNMGQQIKVTSADLATERATVADLFALNEDIVRSLASGLMTVDKDDKVTSVNKAAAEMLLCTPKTAVGGDVSVCLPGIKSKFAELNADGAMRRGDMEVTLASGGVLSLGVSISPLRDKDELVVGRVINFQDLTELRKMEKLVKRGERLATVGTLAAGVAHEIRNPLAAISGSIELLFEDLEAGKHNTALMGIITREVERLDALISEILDYTNPATKEKVQFDVVSMLSETVQVFSSDRNFEGIQVAPLSVLEPAWIEGNPAGVRQVVWNLLRNAAEASANGKGLVSVSVKKQKDCVIFCVSDTGPGIPDNEVERIFDPFYTTKGNGTGLGLATSYSIVTEHDGQIWADSQVGQGTRFSVRLPRISRQLKNSGLAS